MNIMTKDRDFYKELVRMALPMAMQNLINVGVTMADSVMIGALGDVALAGVTQAGKFGTIYMLLIFGLGSGTNVLAAQYWGRRDSEAIRKLMTIMYRILLIGGSIFTILAIFFPYQAMSVFSNDAAVQQAGADYLRIIGFSYLMSGFVTTTLTVQRSVGTVNIGMGVYLCSLLVNISINYVLIFGKFGAPKLGVVGAAIGTVVGRLVETLIVLYFLSKIEDKILYKPSDFFSSTKKYHKTYFKTSTPVITNELVWGTGSTIIGIIIGNLGREFTAAESIATIVGQLMTVFVWGIAHASSAMIGNTIGAGKKDKAIEYGRTFQVLSVILGLTGCLIVMIIRKPVISFFNISDISKDYAHQILTVYAFIVIFQSIAAVCLMGLLRGSGNSMFVLICDLVFMWTISIPMGYLSGYVLGLPLVFVYLFIRSDEVFKSVVATIKLGRGNWVHDIVSSDGETVLIAND